MKMQAQAIVPEEKERYDLHLKAGLHCKVVAALDNTLPRGLRWTWLLFVTVM